MSPYQIYFPLGVLLAAIGTGMWIPLGMDLLPGYPAREHANVMVGGFLLSFAAGFLLTALPKYLGARSARPHELALGGAGLIAAAVASSLENAELFHLASGFLLLLLIGFGASRLVSASFSPPVTFAFIPTGLFSGLAGSLLAIGTRRGWLGDEWAPVGKLFFEQGMMLNLVLGVGGELIPSLLGWRSSSVVTIASPRSMLIQRLKPWVFLFLSAGVVIALFLEGSGGLLAGRLIKAAIASLVGFTAWKLHRLPRTRSRLTFWLWVACWSLVAGLWLPLAFPSQAVHVMHLAFVGGFALMALIVGSRIVLAHGGYPVEIERNSIGLRWGGALILLAALTRASVMVAPASYRHHLAYAGVVFVLGLAIWAREFIPRTLRAFQS